MELEAHQEHALSPGHDLGSTVGHAPARVLQYCRSDSTLDRRVSRPLLIIYLNDSRQVSELWKMSLLTMQ
jgi:hypothetical protein